MAATSERATTSARSVNSKLSTATNAVLARVSYIITMPGGVFGGIDTVASAGSAIASTDSAISTTDDGTLVDNETTPTAAAITSDTTSVPSTRATLTQMSHMRRSLRLARGDACS
jgi:hypothetical protein